MQWKLKVSGYGRIERADIEVAPLTLFVGDNNSGKSYLMSLLWGIQNFGMIGLIPGSSGQRTKEEQVLVNWAKYYATNAWEHGRSTAPVHEVAEELQIVLQEKIDENKQYIARKIFNSWEVNIEAMEIDTGDLSGVELYFERVKGSVGEKTDKVSFKSNKGFGITISGMRLEKPDEATEEILETVIFSIVTGIPLGHDEKSNRNIYLPAARTGFMLTKDIINKAGRNTAFNIGEEEKPSPFTRPINQFLDVINDLTFEARGKGQFQAITEYLEQGMAEGRVEMSTLPNKEVSYVPAGQEEAMPLRIVSAVVTELSPLILILKHKESLDGLFYEEPEMCLHPQLQQKMARVICQLVNAQVNMVVTTHSDIILQHVNNMIRLKGREDRDEICKKLGYGPADLLDGTQVKVYELKVRQEGCTEVKEVVCGPYGFAIPAFNDALDRIMDEAYTIQE